MKKAVQRHSAGKKRSSARVAATPIAGDTAACVWRDSLGPGFAVAASGRLVAYAASSAAGPYKCLSA
jgi:hypothetical protein